MAIIDFDIHGQRAFSCEAGHRRRWSHWQDLHPGQVRLSSSSFVENKFPKEYEPTVFDNLTTTIKIDSKIINLGLWYCLIHSGILPGRKNSEDYVPSPTPALMSSSSPSQSSTLHPSLMLARRYSLFHAVVPRNTDRRPWRSQDISGQQNRSQGISQQNCKGSQIGPHRKGDS